MAIKVRLEALRMGRRKVDVRLKMATDRSLDGTAQIGQRRQTLMHLGQGNGGARTEQLVGARQVNPARRIGVWKRVVLRFELPRRVNQKYLRTARACCREIAIDYIDA